MWKMSHEYGFMLVTKGKLCFRFLFWLRRLFGSKIKGVWLQNAWNARPQTRTQDVYPELQNFVLEKFCTVLLKIVLSLRDSTLLSLSALQCLNCQANQTASNFSSKVTSANVRQAPLFLHTTEPQVFNYSRLISHMWQINQGHWQSKLDPPGPHATVYFSYYHLQAWRQAQ